MSPRLLLKKLAQAFWVIPAGGAVLAALVALLAVHLDRTFGGSEGLLFAGGPESARSILSVVASSVLTFAGLTFSITIVALQLASSQFSPRVLNSLLRDRWTQFTLAIFVGSFVLSLLVLREVRGNGEDFVPGLGVSLALLLGLTSVGTLVGFIHHMAQSLRVVTIIDRIHGETQKALVDWYEEPSTDPVPRGEAPHRPRLGPETIVRVKGNGSLVYFDRDKLTSRAVKDDLSIELLVAPGTWLCDGQPLIRVHGDVEDPEGMLASVRLESERSTAWDPAYGFRQMVDIAERALSPGVNDPTTAVQCVDRMHAMLRWLASRNLAVGDSVVEGVLRMRVPVATWEDYLGLACDEVRHWGAGSVRIHRRLEAMLTDLLGEVESDRADAVRRQLDHLRRRRVDETREEWTTTQGVGDPAERAVS